MPDKMKELNAPFFIKKAESKALHNEYIYSEYEIFVKSCSFPSSIKEL